MIRKAIEIGVFLLAMLSIEAIIFWQIWQMYPPY